MKKLMCYLLQTGAHGHLLPIRLALGLVFLGHGTQKLFGVWGGYGLVGTAQYMSKIGLEPGWFWAWSAALGEWGGGLLILLGLLTRLGAFSVAVCMLVAIFLAQEHTFFLPEGIEYCFVLLLASVTLMIGGGGQFSLDRLLSKK